MARLDDSQNRGLPRPPAPPRRGANPWKLSDSARRPAPAESPQPSLGPQLLAELLTKTPVEDAAVHEAPPPGPRTKRSGPGLIGLVFVLIAASIVWRMFFEERSDGDWMKFIGPLVVIAFIAHGLWRSRRRAQERNQD